MPLKPIQYMCDAQRGFTLIELIIVIILLGVISVGFGSIFVQSVQNYLDANARYSMSSSARLALERITREMRDALPNSVRIDASGNCVEFVPILIGSLYLDVPVSSAASSYEAIAFSAALPVTANTVAVMPLSTAEVYGPTPGAASLAYLASPATTPANTNTVNIMLSSSRVFARTSPEKRFFITSAPVSFCITAANELRRYSAYGSLVTQPTTTTLTGGALLAQNILAGNAGAPVFRYTAGVMERNALLQMAFTLSGQNDTLLLTHEVMVRNVP